MLVERDFDRSCSIISRACIGTVIIFTLVSPSSQLMMSNFVL